VSDDPGASGLALAFSGDGHPNFITVMPKGSAHLRVLKQLAGEGGNVFFNGGVAFADIRTGWN